MSVVISVADPEAADVQEMIRRHLRFTGGVTPADFAFALDHQALSGPDVTVFGLWVRGELLAMGALKRLDDGHAELKSITPRRRRGDGASGARCSSTSSPPPARAATAG